MAQGDSITSTAGDDGRNIATGKGVEQRVTENQAANVVNNYLDRNNPERSERKGKITLDERLDRLEQNANEHKKMLDRLTGLMDGDPGYRFVGLLDQLEATSRSDMAWKTATEKRILTTEDRLDRLEENKKYPIESSTALLVIVILILLAVIVVMGLSRLQNAGQGAVAMSLLQMAAFAVQGNWRGTII